MAANFVHGMIDRCSIAKDQYVLVPGDRSIDYDLDST